MELRKSKYCVLAGNRFLSMGVLFSIFALFILFVDIPGVVAFSGKAHLNAQCDYDGECDMEDEPQDNQDPPTLAFFSKKEVLIPLLSFPIEPSFFIAHGNQRPLDFPPETFPLV